MASINQIKETIQEKREELTKANAVMGEVKDNITKETKRLEEAGVEIPERPDGQSDADYYQSLVTAGENKIKRLEDQIADKKEEVEQIIAKFDE